MTTKLWGARFSGELDALMKELNDSIKFDVRLWAADIRGSLAYSRALARAGIITRSESAQLAAGLNQVHAEFASGAFEIRPGDEDIHTAVERRLRELAGDVAGKLHTGRSRNDQIATDMRLFCLEAIARTRESVRDLQEALVGQAQHHVTTLMPGYTHVQRAQPITFGHWCLAYFWMLQRDIERLEDCRRRTAVLPLGSGALAGNPFKIDRAFLARELGFVKPGAAAAGRAARPVGVTTENSLDAVSDRDFVAELLFTCAMIGMHVSRLAEDLVFYSSAEFGFVTFADAYSTGSSLMPQKKNADSAELARGKSGRLIGNLVSLLTVFKGTPMTYNKDFQEDKEPLFDSIDTLTLTLPVMAGALRTLTINTERMRAALDPAMLATDVAEYLVRKGMPFREAHHMSGRAVALAEQKRVRLSELGAADWASISARFEPDIADVFDFAKSVNSRDVQGGTSEHAVRAQLRAARKQLAAD